MYWWGTYPEAGLGTPTGMGEGLWRHDDSGATQVLTLASPTFVVAHPDLPVLYAVSETDTTEVHLIDITDPAAPVVQASIPTGGRSGCHLLLSRDALTLYVSHYSSGDLAVVSLGASGEFVGHEPAQVWEHAGSGPRTDRQESPHAHFAGYSPGDTHLLVCDLGTDELRRYAIRSDGLLDDAGVATVFPGGSGPRHFAVRGSLIYVVCELDHMLRTLRWDSASATAQIIAEQPTTLAPLRSGDTIYDAHVDMVGDLLLVSVRGCDVISVFDLSPEGEIRYRAAFDTGPWPRHFAVHGERLLVGAEKGHHVRVFDLADVMSLAPESESGAVAELEYSSAEVKSPACIVAT